MSPANRPRRLSRSARQLWVFVHVTVSVGWFGAGATNLVLAVSAWREPEGRLPALNAFNAIHLIDAYVVIPAAFAALITGVVLSVGTSWGLTRHWWVLIKLLLTIAVILFATFGLGVWVEQSLTAATSPHAVAIVVAAAGNLVAFALMTWLSIRKPRGETPWSSPARPRATSPARRT